MDLVILPQHWSALLCVIIIFGAIAMAVIKKWMITYALIIANIIIFVITLIYHNQLIGTLSVNQTKITIEYAGLGFRPLYLESGYTPQLYTLFTSMFIHGGFAHIFGNMLVLFFVGIPFEERIGWKKFLTIYIVTGICGSLVHSFLNLDFPNNYITLIGASGAIFGIMGAFAFSYPTDEVVMPIPLGIIMILRRIKVVYAVILFAVLETVIVFIDIPDGTAHYAHFGGLLGGLVLAALLLRGRRTHTKAGQTIYYNPYQSQKTENIDLEKLEQFATTPELKELLLRIKNETVSQVKEIWLEYFIEKAVCPKCGDKLFRMDNKIWCEKCGFKTKL